MCEPVTSTADSAARIWLIDLGRQLHSVRLDGFDISAGQYPPQEWLPGNISLTTLDVHEPIPEALHGKYDVVHVRLFLTVVRNDDPRPILANMLRMLSQSCFDFSRSHCLPSMLANPRLLPEPGGYLQWSEHNLATASVERVRPGIKTDDLQSLIDHARRVTCRFVRRGYEQLKKLHI